MTLPTADPVLESLTSEQLHRIRAQNDRRFASWSVRDVVRLHERTAGADGDLGVAYRAGIRRHLASGLYRRIYSPLVVEATQAYLARHRD